MLKIVLKFYQSFLKLITKFGKHLIQLHQLNLVDLLHQLNLVDLLHQLIRCHLLNLYLHHHLVHLLVMLKIVLKFYQSFLKLITKIDMHLIQLHQLNLVDQLARLVLLVLVFLAHQ